MNPFQAEIWDPGLLAETSKKDQQQQLQRKSRHGRTSSDTSSIGGDSEGSSTEEYESSGGSKTQRKGGRKSVTGNGGMGRKLSFSRDPERLFGFGPKRRTPSPGPGVKGGHGSGSTGGHTIWYRIFHPGEEDDHGDLSGVVEDTAAVAAPPVSASATATQGKGQGFMWARSRRTYESDDEYHSSDDSSIGSSPSAGSLNALPTTAGGSIAPSNGTQSTIFVSSKETSKSVPHLSVNNTDEVSVTPSSSGSTGGTATAPLPPAPYTRRTSSTTSKKGVPASKTSSSTGTLNRSQKHSPSIFHPRGDDEESSEEDLPTSTPASAQLPPPPVAVKRSTTNIFKDLFWRSSSASNTASNHAVHHDLDQAASPSGTGSPSSSKTPGGLLEIPFMDDGGLSDHSTTSSHPSTSSAPPMLKRNPSEISLSEKYGRKDSVLGRGATAVVRLCCPANASTMRCAIKEFRKRRKDERQKEYVKKLVAEFCISSSLDHPNVVKTIDLIQDEKHTWCVVMEYCEGGDLFTRITSGTLTNAVEYNCYFKQLILGVQYLHSMGVAHRDLKPENLLLDKSGKMLKITDFGVSEVFRAPFTTGSKKAHGLCGSGPYIAPEEYIETEYDSESVDVWAMGIIYFVMANMSCPWRAATNTDSRYMRFVDSKNTYYPIERLPPGPRHMLYTILNPDPLTRISVKGLLDDPWIKGIHVCYNDKSEPDHVHELK